MVSSGFDGRPVVALTACETAGPCVAAARSALSAAGYEVAEFRATGAGGRAMEELVRGGRVAGVLDLSTGELADELVGGLTAAGPDRLTAAALAGIPQVISVGGLDAVTFGPPDSLPVGHRGRRTYPVDPTTTLVRTTPEENDRLGQEIAQKASAARGPTAVLLPLRGTSTLDVADGPFWWPEANAALFQSVRNWAYAVDLIELDLHVNDPAFAAAAVAKLMEYLTRR